MMEKKKVYIHLQNVRKKHPVFSHSRWQTVSIAAEEFGEWAQAVNDKDYEKAKQEAADLIAVIIRHIEGD